MSKKTVCDICGADADDREYIVPFVNTYFVERDRVKLAAFDRLEPCAFNLCQYHCNQLACLLKSWYESYNKG